MKRKLPEGGASSQRMSVPASDPGEGGLPVLSCAVSVAAEHLVNNGRATDVAGLLLASKRARVELECVEGRIAGSMSPKVVHGPSEWEAVSRVVKAGLPCVCGGISVSLVGHDHVRRFWESYDDRLLASGSRNAHGMVRELRLDRRCVTCDSSCGIPEEATPGLLSLTSLTLSGRFAISEVSRALGLLTRVTHLEMDVLYGLDNRRGSEEDTANVRSLVIRPGNGAWADATGFVRRNTSLTALDIDCRDADPLCLHTDVLRGMTALERLVLRSVRSAIAIPGPSMGVVGLRELTVTGFYGPLGIPADIAMMSHLTFLEISEGCFDSGITGLERVCKVKSLRSLHIEGYGHEHGSLVPERIGDLSSLTSLHMDGFDNESLPDSLYRLVSLESLHLAVFERLVDIDDRLGNLTRLTRLYLSILNRVKNLPDAFSGMVGLARLELIGLISLEGLPPSLESSTSVARLSVRGCPKFRMDVSRMSSLSSLTMQMMHVGEQLWESVSKASLTSLELCGVYDISDRLYRISSLRSLRFVCMRDSILGGGLGELTALEHLEVSYWPELRTVPESLGMLSRLKTLSFRECQLYDVPRSFSGLKSLEWFTGCKNMVGSHSPDRVEGVAAFGRWLERLPYEPLPVPDRPGHVSSI